MDLSRLNHTVQKSLNILINGHLALTETLKALSRIVNLVCPSLRDRSDILPFLSLPQTMHTHGPFYAVFIETIYQNLQGHQELDPTDSFIFNRGPWPTIINWWALTRHAMVRDIATQASCPSKSQIKVASLWLDHCYHQPANYIFRSPRGFKRRNNVKLSLATRYRRSTLVSLDTVSLIIQEGEYRHLARSVQSFQRSRLASKTELKSLPKLPRLLNRSFSKTSPTVSKLARVKVEKV